MPLDLDKLASSATLGAKMPETKRGREATPVPDGIVKAVKSTFDLPEGTGGSFKVPNGDVTENGKDANVTTVIGQLRRAAAQLGYGLSVKTMTPTAKTTEVLFKAKTKSVRTRRTKDEKRADDLIAGWLAAETVEYDGAEDDAVAVAAWDRYLALPEDGDDGEDA